MKKLVGLSLSFCVAEILRRRIAVERVAFIVPGFSWNGKPSDSYYDIYWKDFTREQIDAVLSQIEIRPLPEGMEPQNVSQGIWWPAAQWDWSVIGDYTQRLRTEDVIDGPYGIHDRIDDVFLGDDSGPFEYHLLEDARLAATIVNERLQYGEGRIRARMIPKNINHKRDEVSPALSALEAIQRLESGSELTTGNSLPPELVRDLPPIQPHRSSHKPSRQLVLLAQLHPQVEELIRDKDLRKCSSSTIEQLLASANQLLGIKPLLSKRLDLE